MADNNYFPWRYRSKLQHPIHTCINRRHHFQTSLFPKWEWNRNRVSFCRFWAEAQANKQTLAAKNASLMLWIKLRVQFVLKHEWMATAGILPWMGCCGGGKKTVGKCSLEQCRKYVLDNTSCWKRVRSKKGVGKRCWKIRSWNVGNAFRRTWGWVFWDCKFRLTGDLGHGERIRETQNWAF